MKAITISVLAASLALATPAFAEESRQPAQPDAMQGAMAPPDGKAMQQMQGNLTKMRAQLEQLGKAKTPEERQKVMNAHMQTMQENMGMARGMQSSMMGCPMMQGGMMSKGMMRGGQGMMGQGMAGTDDMMARRVDMMEKRMDMMQMMMQGRMGMPDGAPAKPAN
ncbi:MAG: hypothetical protein KJ787_09155 [Gammaproteobacteria bacterium]|nr:hypothetical protein [Gammaproteobacteria bacterium]MBU1646489.1 hypothetical protein [Gammaproteobacteria bacterium]MBU1971032.1 hypothetical protein [Gammaproteobacteria bacterium]